MRPTKGEIRNTPASAQATAWANENSSVRLVWMPAFSRRSAVRMPSQVEASLISTRSRPMPAWSYSAINWLALAHSASSSKDKRASTSVEMRPGITLRMPAPTDTAKWSHARPTSPLDRFTALRSSSAYSGMGAALSSSDGLVVASTGRRRLMASRSPVSQTTVVNCLSCSSLDVMGGGLQRRQGTPVVPFPEPLVYPLAHPSVLRKAGFLRPTVLEQLHVYLVEQAVASKRRCREPLLHVGLIIKVHHHQRTHRFALGAQ